ncbi:hypothetical protein WNY51_08380 [Pseudocolwellia sp. AS88]|uniref:hypothetical protein n=1 Tax=Pseudocolwellia sp. AS88 TaxID=3063958 RepID=UPI0026EEABB9|nr:hypothetical protein [Pseudocolwellia sp. AS88]MDO7085893.1 hypothetical protein [Pseudocolwellia sp. AS88]
MDAIEKFKVLIRKEFQFLCDDFEFKEEVFNTYSEYSISYANSTTRVIVEGVNWGANVRVALGSLSCTFEDYDLGDLVTIDSHEAWDSFVKLDMPQNEQLPYLHSFLITCGKDILSGNFTIFPQLNEICKKKG